MTILKNQLKESQAENERLKLQIDKEKAAHSIELKKALKESEVKFEVKMQRNFEFTSTYFYLIFYIIIEDYLKIKMN